MKGCKCLSNEEEHVWKFWLKGRNSGSVIWETSSRRQLKDDNPVLLSKILS